MQVVYTLFGMEVWRSWRQHYCALQWQRDGSTHDGGPHAVLCVYEDERMLGGAAVVVSLQRCLVAAKRELDRPANVDPAYWCERAKRDIP